MENINRENFWNKLDEINPGELKKFCDWIDEYKKEVNWNLLFNSDSEYQNAQGKNAKAPKFHGIPVEMQVGILEKYLAEKYKVWIRMVKWVCEGERYGYLFCKADDSDVNTPINSSPSFMESKAEGIKKAFELIFSNKL